jgi:branched-chain amino acid transport system substrate-binding protein
MNAMKNLIIWLSFTTGIATALLGAQAQAQDIVLGQSVPLSGTNADIGRDMRDGALAVFNKVNASGILGSRKIQLVTLDNNNSRPRALENTKLLLDTNKAVALFGYNSATTSLDALPLLKLNNMAMFAPFTGSPSARNHPNVFTIRASYKDEAEKIVSQQKAGGATKAVVLYYDDEAGKANVEMVSAVFDAANKPRTLAVKRNMKLDSAVFEPILKELPHYVLATTQFTVVGDLLQAAQAKGVSVSVAALSFVNPDELADTYGNLARGTIVSQVVPAPRGANLISNAVLKDCAALLQTLNGSKLNYTSFESCLAAKAIVRVIQKVGLAKVTRASLLQGLERAGKIDLDGFVLDFGKDNHGSHLVDLTILSRNGQFAK